MSTAIAQLPTRERTLAHDEWPFEVGLVYLRDLIVDDRYQRPLDRKFVDEIAAAFDPTLIGTLDVNERQNGTFAVLDGQQRLGGMGKVGKTACYCSIYRGMNVSDEAGFFYRKNRDRKTMKVYYAFRARGVAGDEETLAIQALVEGQGFLLGPSPDDRDTIGAIRAVEVAYAYSSEHRTESLSRTLETIRESVYGRKSSLDATLILAVGRFWQSYADEEVQAGIVQEILADYGPTSFLGAIRERRAATVGASGPWLGARIIGENYNRRLRGAKRGPTFAGKLDLGRVGPGAD